MKKKKRKFSMSFIILLISIFVSSSTLKTFNINALVDQNHFQQDLNTCDELAWKWNKTEVISFITLASCDKSSIAVDSAGSVHIAWEDYTDYAGAGTDYDIFYRRWDATSFSWTITEVVTTESTVDSQDPSLAVDSSGSVHITWWEESSLGGSGSDRDIFYKRWNSSSDSWTTTEVISNDSTSNSAYPSLAIDSSGSVHIAWDDYTDYAGAGTDCDIFYKSWDKLSSSWTTTEVVSTESTSTSREPSLAVDSTGDIHIAWEDFTDYAGAGSGCDIFYKRKDVSTSSWTITEVVSTESTDSTSYPSLAVDLRFNVHVAWQDMTDYAGAGADDDVFYKKRDSFSSTWSTTEIISVKSTSDSQYPSLAADSKGSIHVVWYDETNNGGSGTDSDIFYKQWDSVSSSWATTEVVSTESNWFSEFPSLAVDSFGNAYVSWRDYTELPGEPAPDFDIFYKTYSCPPTSPDLSYILPNLNNPNIVNLEWNKVYGAKTYHIYRATSYITSLEGLDPITSVASNNLTDIVPSEGLYYYSIVAENFAGNSTHSNCQYIEVEFSDLDSPELAPILPNPTDLASISLAWDSIDEAVEYYVYRSNSYIWSVEGLTPIDSVGTNSFNDILPSEGHYFYVIVATDSIRNSTQSNCEYIEYELPHVHEYVILSSMIIGVFVLLYAVTRRRKRVFKAN
ncbi:MAG: hypothetical protein ACFFDS_04475 [Candidatus Thorarchaeota archaeon]